MNRQDEEQRRHGTSLSNTGRHAETGFAVSHSALEVVVEAIDDKDDLLWNSICPEYAPLTFSLLPHGIDVTCAAGQCMIFSIF